MKYGYIIINWNTISYNPTIILNFFNNILDPNYSHDFPIITINNIFIFPILYPQVGHDFPNGSGDSAIMIHGHHSWMRTGAPLTLGSESINIFGALEGVCIYVYIFLCYINFMCHFVWRNKQTNNRTNEQTNEQTNKQTNRQTHKQSGIGDDPWTKTWNNKLGILQKQSIPKHKKSMAVLLWFRGPLLSWSTRGMLVQTMVFQQDHQGKSVATKKPNAKKQKKCILEWWYTHIVIPIWWYIIMINWPKEY